MLPEDTFTSLNRHNDRPAFPFHQRHLYGPSTDEGSKRLARWSLLIALMLAVWCVILFVSAVSHLLPGGYEKSLPVAQSWPKLNPWEGEAPAEPVLIAPARQEPRPPESETVVMAPPQPLPPALFDEPPLLPEVHTRIEVPQLPALPEPSRIEVPAPLPQAVVDLFAEPPLLLVEARIEEPAIDLAYLVAPERAHHLGDSPMTRTWKLLSASTIVTAALAMPAPAEAQDDIKAIGEKIDKLEKSIKESFGKVAKDVADLRIDVTGLQSESVTQRSEHGKTALRVEKLEAAVESLRRKLETPALYPPTDQFGEIKKQLTSIEQALKGMNGVTQVTKSSPLSGRLMLVNMYPEDLLFIVNQREIRVRPGEMRPLEGVPAGPVTYEIFSPTYGPRGRITTGLNPNETLTLTAR